MSETDISTAAVERLAGVLKRKRDGTVSGEFSSHASDVLTGLLADRDRLAAEVARLKAERDAAMSGRVKVKPLTFEWAKDESIPNLSCWRCEGEGFFAYVLIPYDPGNDPAAGIGKWNANPNHRGRMGFETREAAMAYCEEVIRRQAASEVKHAIDKLALWAEAAIQPDTERQPLDGQLRAINDISEDPLK